MKSTKQQILIGFILLTLLVIVCLYYYFSFTTVGATNNENEEVLEFIKNNHISAEESHNKEWMAIVKDTGIKKPSKISAEGFDSYNQIILRNFKNPEKKIVIDSSSIKFSEIIGLPEDFPRDNLTDLANPLFSLDDKRVYFSASAWTTSSAIFSFDIERNQISYLVHGEIKEVISEGENEGSLLVTQRKLGDKGGAMYCEVVVDANKGDILKEINECKD